jgi:uncharacterized protein
MFFGRDKEFKYMDELYSSEKSELLVIYGRRRVGKTALVNKFLETKKAHFSLEGIEGVRKDEQIVHFARAILNDTHEEYISPSQFTTWESLLTYFTDKVVAKKRKKKLIIFLDEIQWLATKKSKLIALLKLFYDTKWKQHNVMLILCGSIASYMVNQVIKSKALYGRITGELLVKGLPPNEAVKLFQQKRSKEEILKYLLVFGGIPKYLEEISLKHSFPQNMNRLLFSAPSALTHEMERIFYSQFKDARTYKKIINILRNTHLNTEEIAHKLGKKSGGSLTRALNILKSAELIAQYRPISMETPKKRTSFRVTDEFLTFYFTFIEPNRAIIEQVGVSNLFEKITKDRINVWFGFAFERFCHKNALYLASKMGFEDQVLQWGPWLQKGPNGSQIDLVYKRVDNTITICEIKHRNTQITTAILPEMNKKTAAFKAPRGYTVEKALISLFGPDKHLQSTQYFHHTLTLNDILPDQ